MVVNVVVRIADLDSLVRCYATQLALCWPAHVWYAVKRSTPVAADAKHRLHERLVDLEARLGPNPLARPPARILHEGWTIDHVVSAMLAPSAARRCLAEAPGEFHGVPVEAGASDRTVPFPGTYFVVTSEATYEGHGALKEVMSRGTTLVRHVRSFPDHPADSDGGGAPPHSPPGPLPEPRAARHPESPARGIV